jgi:D-beta-D-heptose 7-phosphate kinase/D-beta-D-heptose 1-phosphate adenosyltransferase
MKKILIVGESCLDIFVYCYAERLCPDIPVPALRIVKQTENPGMAKNVERNIQGIMDDCDIVTNSNWRTVTKTRYMDLTSNHMFIRVDTDHKMERVDVRKIPLDYNMLAISDYNKGFLTEEDIEYFCEHHDNVFIDTKKVLGDWVAKAKFIKINNYEYERSKNSITKMLNDKVICTKGEFGAVFRGKIYPVKEKVEVKDVSGAGDSFFAALLVKYAETGDIEEAIHFANECASEVVKHKGVTSITIARLKNKNE